MSTVFAPVFEPGFFADEAVRQAILVGTLVAVVAGAVGLFTVMRSQSFAAEALGDLGTAGGSGAFLLGAGALSGFLAVDVLAALVMQLVGVERLARAATWPPGSCWARVSAGGAAAVPGNDRDEHHRRNRHGPVRLDLLGSPTTRCR
jgi:hypothetical protein